MLQLLKFLPVCRLGQVHILGCVVFLYTLCSKALITLIFFVWKRQKAQKTLLLEGLFL